MTAGRGSRRALWRNRDYMILFSGQAVSNLGTNVSQIAFPLLVLAITRSPAQAGFVGAVRLLPYILISLPAGAWVDRWDRKRAMILCDSGRAISMATIPLALWAGHLSILQLYAVSLVEGMLMVPFSLSQTASIPRVVGKDQLPAAMANNEFSFNLSSMLGPFLGGLLYGFGRAVPFLADAISYGASVCSLSFIERQFQDERVAPRRRLHREIGEGLAWLWNQPVVRTIAFLSTIAWIMLSAMELVVIVLARQEHASPAVIGLIFAMGGAGGLVGAVIAGRIGRYLSFGGTIIGSCWVWAVLWPLYALAPNPVVLAMVTGLLFVVWPVYNVTQMSYRLSIIPDELQGRVNSVFRLVAFTGQPVGFAVAGLLLQVASPRAAILAVAVAPLALALGATFSGSIRRARPLSEVRAA